MFLALHLAFAGLAPMLAHLLLGAIGAAICVALGLYSPLARKDCFMLAFVIIYGLAMEAVGIHDEKVRVAAQEQVIQQSVDKAVGKATTNGGTDPWDRGDY